MFDKAKPDGTPRKLIYVKKLEVLGYVAPTALQSGIELAYVDFFVNGSELRMQNPQLICFKDTVYIVRFCKIA
ncbi:hypothetical protein N9Q41_01445 [Amylibacter sp.]|nr:hypothetical protein [Amylibacter sp.]